MSEAEQLLPHHGLNGRTFDINGSAEADNLSHKIVLQFQIVQTLFG